jgi:hypothetical protein
VEELAEENKGDRKKRSDDARKPGRRGGAARARVIPAERRKAIALNKQTGHVGAEMARKRRRTETEFYVSIIGNRISAR